MHPALSRALDSPIQANVLVAFCDLSRYRQASKGRSSADIFVNLNDFYLLVDDAIQADGGLAVTFR